MSIISICLPQANYSKNDMIYIIVGFVFIIIGVIIYNEFILIHLCGMDVNTKKEIAQSSDCEIEQIIEINNRPTVEGGVDG